MKLFKKTFLIILTLLIANSLFISCSPEPVTNIPEETPKKEKYLSKKEFLEYVNDYDLISKALDYSEDEYKTLEDWSGYEITDQEASFRYSILIQQIDKDLISFEGKWGNNKKDTTEEQKYIIRLIRQWAGEKKRYCSFISDCFSKGDTLMFGLEHFKEKADKTYKKYISAITGYMGK